MKHTMKKLLCMALAIMLLVSAVPVFAAAADVTMPYILVIDGETRASSTYQTTDTTSLSAILEDIYPGYSASYYVGFKIDGVVVDGGAAAPASGTVTFELTTPPAPPTPEVVVTIVLSGVGQRSFNVVKGGTVTLNQALLNSYGLSLSYNHSIVQWSDNYNPHVPIANGTTVTVNDNTTFTCTQRNNNVGGEGSGSENNGGNGGTTTTTKYNVKFYDVNGSCHWNIDVASGSTVGIADNSTATQITYAEANVGTKSGYTFSGWRKNGTGDVLSTATVADLAITANTDFRPVFTANGSSSNGGSTSTTGILNLIVNVNDSLYKSYAIADFTQDTINNLLKAKLGSKWADSYSYNNTVVGGVTYNSADVTVKAGQTATVSLSRKYSKDNSNKVYLHVYLNGDASTIALTKDITGTYLMDDWYTDTTEILNYLKNNYYSAKDSSNAVTIDGLYVNTGSDGTFPANYYADKTQASVGSIKDKLEDGYVHISVMLKNAKAKSSATADSSNPKTGDAIYVPVMIMGVTATALAAAYVFGKKRIAR